MKSRRPSRFIAQLLFLMLLSCFVQIGHSRDVNGSRLVQLNDCTCLGYTQTFECTVFGGGFTVWNSTFFDCQDVRNEIQLRHSQYDDEDPSPYGCNHGAVMSKSIGVFSDCYTSQLTIIIGGEMINKTIGCSYDDFQERIIVGQRPLIVTETPYPPPTNVHIETNDSHQITFAWDEVTTQCSSLQYVISAINCGVCPNSTTDKNVTCNIQSDISLHTSNTCLFAVQTEICGDILGERSNYIIVYIDGINASEKRKGEATTLMSLADSELVNNAIVIPLVASIMSIGVFLLLIIVIVLIIYMSKQITKNYVKSSGVDTTRQDDAFVNHGTAAQNNQEGIYSLLQPSEDNDMLDSDHKEVVVYADIGPSPGEGLHCETALQFQDDKVEYAEVKSPNHEPALNDPSQSPDSNVPLDLKNLLHQIGTEVSPKWYQLGIAVGISEELLDECSNRSPEEAVVEVLDYWIRKHKPSWEDVAEVLNEIGLHKLANSLCQGKLQRAIEDDDRIEDLCITATSPAHDDSS